MMPLLGHRYSKITFEEVKDALEGLDLEIVGGLKKRGFTTNDLDVVGNILDVPTFSARLKRMGIRNPIHWCGTRANHSHLQCAYYGVKLALTGRGY